MESSIRKRHRVIIDKDTGIKLTLKYLKPIPRPNMVELYHVNMGAVDQHNRKRQGDLAIHTHRPTRTWWHRVFSTFYGIMITDTYFMYSYSMKAIKEENKIMIYIKFCDKLACQLIHFKKPISGMNEANVLMVIPTMHQVFI